VASSSEDGRHMRLAIRRNGAQSTLWKLPPMHMIMSSAFYRPLLYSHNQRPPWPSQDFELLGNTKFRLDRKHKWEDHET